MMQPEKKDQIIEVDGKEVNLGKRPDRLTRRNRKKKHEPTPLEKQIKAKYAHIDKRKRRAKNKVAKASRKKNRV
jgi:hypothetical protein